MLNYKVACAKCEATILMTEDSLMHSSSLICPHCNFKLPEKELKHLKSDLQYRKKHTGFHVSITDTQDIDFNEIIEYASLLSLNSLFTDFKQESFSENEASAFFSNNVLLANYCNRYSNALLIRYHLQLASKLRELGIEIGNVIADPPSEHSSFDIPSSNN